MAASSWGITASIAAIGVRVRVVLGCLDPRTASVDIIIIIYHCIFASKFFILVLPGRVRSLGLFEGLSSRVFVSILFICDDY